MSDFTIIKTTPVEYETVYIGDGQYQVPTPVVKELTRLVSTVEALRIDNDEARAKKRQNNKEIADRIVMNLISGEPYGRSVLKYAIDKFDKVENGQPVFEFRHEVENRIMLALENKGMDGEPGTIGKGSWKTVV